jgi:hypothetical protein
VTRTGGAVSTFGSASSTTGSMAFTLPPGSNRLVAMVTLNSTSPRVTSVTWKPNPADPSQDQALTFLARQVSTGNKGAVEIWELANPNPGVSGSTVSHVLSANAKRIMGLHALAGVASVGTPVGAAVNGGAIGVTVASQPGGLVLDVLHGLNTTTSYTAGAGQTEHWDLMTTGIYSVRGCGSTEAGAPTVNMTWAVGQGTHLALLAVSYNPFP